MKTLKTTTMIALKNKNFRAEILKKGGSIKSIYKDVIDRTILGTKIYPKRWTGSGRHIRLVDHWSYCTNLIKGLGYTYQVGNDAPRGGVEGNYIKITKKALNAIKEFRNIYNEPEKNKSN